MVIILLLKKRVSSLFGFLIHQTLTDDALKSFRCSSEIGKLVTSADDSKVSLLSVLNPIVGLLYVLKLVLMTQPDDCIILA